jgi:HEAT repeat protein
MKLQKGVLILFVFVLPALLYPAAVNWAQIKSDAIAATEQDIYKWKEDGNVQAIIDVLKNKSESRNVRERAVFVLGDIGNKQATEAIIDAINDEDHEIRSAALYEVGKIGDKRAVDLLIDVLKNKNESGLILRSAAEALGDIGDKRAIGPLISALRNYDFWVRKDIALVLRKFDWQPKDNTEKAWYLVASQEWDKVTTLGSSAIEPLIVALKGEDWGWEVRSAAANALSTLFYLLFYLPYGVAHLRR